ncbi:T9SS type A sorting domain-containing protein, partial [candidate division KSB1 bacterium]|nr:T9SS type A sorting domain-containing protein [candidate division KSB1 bacterium]
VLAGFQITTGQVGAPAYTGFRVIGNYITAPNGDGMDGAINAEGNDVYILGNELEAVGSINCSKLYHAIYVKGRRQDDPPRPAKESNREIGWNFVHECNTNRAINMYSEQNNSAFIERHSVHDNVILNQRGDGIMLGYYVVGENWIYNNLIVRAGLGPEWPDGESYHTGMRINTGHEAVSQTVVHCYHNTWYGCGWSGAVLDGENGHILISPEALTLGTTVHFHNNIIFSAGQPYLARESTTLPVADHRNCWYGHGAAPAWDTGAINTDPEFVETGANNFQLKTGSPCIDAGLNVAAIVDHDLLGTPRPSTSLFDLGVYEFVAPTVIEAGDAPAALIHDFHLYQNYPNPFNHTTIITYALAEPATVKLQVFTLPGQVVKELVHACQTTGFYRVHLDTSDLVSGVYFYRLEAWGTIKYSQTRKFIFIK